MAKSDFKFHHNLRVRWFECDAQGIVFNNAYLIFVELAQVEYYRNLWLRLYNEASRKYFDSATVKVTMEYLSSAEVDDVLEVFSRIANLGRSSIVVETEIYREGSDELLNRSEVVYVNYDAAEKISRPVPDEIWQLITHFEDTGEVLPLDGFPRLYELWQAG